jgi:hydroxypyruvate isomerase
MPRFSANLSFLYPDLEFTDRFAAAARDGFAAVEYVSPYDLPPEAVRRLLDDNRLQQALFNLPAGDWAAGERGIACLPGREAEFSESVDTAIRYAVALGCTRVNCLAGLVPAGADPASHFAVLVANLRDAAPRFADAGIRLLIEPINTRDMPGFFLPTVAMAEAVLAAVGEPNLFIQYDLYHQQVMRGDLVPTFARLRDRIAHIQIADTPGRNEPGTGEINYRFVLTELDRLGYEGWVGCEYRPSGGTGAATGWLAAHGLRLG